VAIDNEKNINFSLQVIDLLLL